MDGRDLEVEDGERYFLSQPKLPNDNQMSLTFAGGWKWIDGSPVAFTNWASGEPDDDSAGCAEIWPDSQGKWFDVSCTVNSHYVCEMPKCKLHSSLIFSSS